MKSQNSDSDPREQSTLNSFDLATEQQAEKEPIRQRIAIGVKKISIRSHMAVFFSGILTSVICALAVGLPVILMSATGISSVLFVRNLYPKHNKPTHHHRTEGNYRRDLVVGERSR